MHSTLRRTSGFTLLELMISMTIFSVMMTIVLSVYFNTTETARRLNMTRQLSETAREITERLAQDIRQYGFSGSATEFDNSYSLWRNTDEYSNSGSEVLNLGNARYVYGKKNL
jgi:type IV pilus assembly protein PilW